MNEPEIELNRSIRKLLKTYGIVSRMSEASDITNQIFEAVGIVSS